MARAAALLLLLGACSPQPRYVFMRGPDGWVVRCDPNTGEAWLGSLPDGWVLIKDPR